jgi:hypothetical protein
MCGASVQDAQHLIQRLAKCHGEGRLNIIGEPVPWAECGTGGDDALPERLAARVAQLRRMSRQWSEPRTEWLGRECAHHLFNKECCVKSRLIELLVGVSRELSLRHAYSSDRIGSPRSASAR